MDKEIFRKLAISGDQHFAGGKVSGMTEWAAALLTAFPMADWRRQRQHNHGVIASALANLAWVTVLQPESEDGTCPFSCILVFDSAERCSYIREKLISSRVYPAVLWPLDKKVMEGISQLDIDFSHRMLSIHCDMRYNEIDMKHVASLIHKYGCENMELAKNTC